ncbi:RAP1 GTPase activating protein 2 [Balamuthia mandrillaris]
MKQQLKLPSGGGPSAANNNNNSKEDEGARAYELEEVYARLRDPRIGLVARDIGSFFWSYKKCFKGYELVMWLMKTYGIDERQANTIGQLLLEKGHFVNAKDSEADLPFSNSAALYRYKVEVEVLNMARQLGAYLSSMTYPIKNPVTLSVKTAETSLAIAEALQEHLTSLLQNYVKEEGRAVDYAALAQGPEFKRYLAWAQELQHVDPSVFDTNQTKAFFINVYNIMVIHAITVGGPPEGRPDFFTGCLYMIGPHKYGLWDIHHGILRGNRHPPIIDVARFQGDDPRRAFSLKKRVDPRVLAALCDGSKSSPSLSVYSAASIDSELEQAMARFVNSIEVDAEWGVVQCPKVFQWYAGDFGALEQDLLNWMLRYLPQDSAKHQALESLLNANSNNNDKKHKEKTAPNKSLSITVQYMPYDWTLNDCSSESTDEDEYEHVVVNSGIVIPGEGFRIEAVPTETNVESSIALTNSPLVTPSRSRNRHTTSEHTKEASSSTSPGNSRSRSGSLSVSRGRLKPTLLKRTYPSNLYKNTFYGKRHETYLGEIPDYGPICISVLPFDAKTKSAPASSSSSSASSSPSSDTTEKFHILLRTSLDEFRMIIPNVPPKELWESLQHIFPFVDKRHLYNIPISSMAEAPNVGSSPEEEKRYSSALSLQNELLQYEQKKKVTQFKCGVLYYSEGQSDEDEIFGNVDIPEAYQAFLNILGDTIALQGWEGYAAGLDVKYNQTGTHSVYYEWIDYARQKKHPIMFHVCQMLPHSSRDPQQIERKRHLGNDSVVIVFHDGTTPFNPRIITSKYIQVFIVVHATAVTTEQTEEEKATTKFIYRVAVLPREAVPFFGPPLPNPPIFEDPELLRAFIHEKVMNAARASFRAPEFKKQMNRSRGLLLSNLVRQYKPN